MAKTTKSGKANKSLVSGGMIVVVVAVILIIACFFTYISGILPQTLTGITITELTLWIMSATRRQVILTGMFFLEKLQAR